MNITDLISKFKPLTSGKELIIVAGMPKSGTTAIAKLLGAATEKKVCSDPFYQLDVQGVNFRHALFSGALSLESLWRKNRRVFKGGIIKDPNFPLLLTQISDFLPESHIVSIVRDPRNNIRSILNRLKLPGNLNSEQLDMSGISPTWKNVLTGVMPDIPGNNYIELMAQRWKLSAEEFIKSDNIKSSIRYEDFNISKSASIMKLANELGYTNLANIDHLVDVQYQPRGDKSSSWLEFFGEKNLDIINEITGPILDEFGYQVDTDEC